MHQNILAQHEDLHIIPGKQFVLRKRRPVVHNLFSLRALFLIDKVTDQHVQRLLAAYKPAKGREYLLIGRLIHPVITVHNFIINALGIAKSCINCLTMSAILLMDSPADTRILSFVFICYLRCTVLRGAVVDNQNLHLVASRQKRFDAVPHIGL